MAIDRKYLEEAKQMLDGSYENQRVQLNNSFNQNVQSLEGQKAGVNQNFDNQLEQNARNTTRSVNQYGNNSLARGLGRSTIAASGQAGIRDQGNRIANEVNEQRTIALGNIDAQKTLLAQALQESLLGLQSQQDSAVLTLAQQLEQQAYDRAFQREQFDWQKSQAGRRTGGSGGGSGSGGNFNATAAWKEFDRLLKVDSTKGWYEAGQFAAKISKVAPEHGAMMMKAYEEMRRKAGSVEKQTATNKNSGKIYTNY